MKRSLFISLVCLSGVGLLGLVFCLNGSKSGRGGWGIDAVLSRHVSGFNRFAYKRLLANSGVGILRERGIGAISGTLEAPGKWRDDVRGHFQDLKQSGYKVVAFTTQPFKFKPVAPGNQLPENLLDVYQQAKFSGRELLGLVDAWEMVGEPDLGFCTDLPDRVAAYQKAMYLGIKAGAKEKASSSARPTADKESGRRLGADGEAKLKAEGSNNSGFRSHVSAQAPLVLMGALGMPPGPWLERAAANGLLDYTDAYNFHFYGHAKDLTGVIEAHRAAVAKLLQLSAFSSQFSAAAPQLPLWITEAGIEAVDKKDWLNTDRRQLQADFTISTAKQALAAKDVAVFMPFILVHDKDPYAMTLSPWKTFSAWDEYAKFTRENPWPKRALSREPRAVSPVVMQWLPDNKTTVPHKVAGTYRFRDGQPIKGELRVYNFGDKPAKGRLEVGELKVGRVILNALQASDHGGLGISRPTTKLGDSMTIPAMGMVAIPLEFTATSGGYFRETFTASFVEENPQVSRVSFGLAAWAKLADFTEEPLALKSLPDGKIRFPQIEPYALGEQVGPWRTINGLKGEEVMPASIQVSGFRSQVSAARFWIEQPNTDPLAPTMAVAAVNGLPSTGFIRLQLDKPMTKDRRVLVVLVDDRGQRYAIWENYGADYYGSRSDVWLNLQDIHADFWGPMSADYHFQPERIREVHLRFYLNTPQDPVRVELSLLTPRLGL